MSGLVSNENNLHEDDIEGQADERADQAPS
jgi:hypothetical protein